ncbi:MAG: sulfite exporter TauE/SafE family protein [Candidatus Magasanikbacteria bacterium]|nr:sulfite exporter TauE/SafE family protein [Candidatus Magasanikbacteria bacterium]
MSLDDIKSVCKDLEYTITKTREKRRPSKMFYKSKEQKIKINWNIAKKRAKKIALFIGIILILRWIDALELGKFMSANGTETTAGIFVLGIVASISSCAALIGGLLLSFTKKWNEQCVGEAKIIKKAKPHISFHTGRIIGFILFGGLLGMIGNIVSFDNPTVFAIIVLVISIAMVIVGLQMLGVRAANKIRFRMPSALSQYAMDKSGKDRAPFFIGAATFFLPCGFTLIAQGIALASGSLLVGALTMGMFALGTLPALIIISATGLQMNKKPHLTAKFNFIAGTLVLMFALYNINGQLNVLGLPSLSDLATKNAQEQIVGEMSLYVSGPQEVKVVAKGFEYIAASPMNIQSGSETTLVVDNQGIVGCGAYLKVSGLMQSYIALKKGKNVIDLGKPKKGTYKITCSMGMVSPIVLKVI